MSDRTFNGVDARLYKEFRISKLSRILLAYIVANCPNQYGIYDPSPEFEAIDWFEGMFTRAELVDAFEELVKTGILKRYRGGECLWLVKKFKREIQAIRNPNNIIGVVKFINEIEEIRHEFWKLFFNQLECKANQFVENGKLVPNWFPEIGNPEPEPEPEPEHKENPNAKTKRKTKKQLKAEPVPELADLMTKMPEPMQRSFTAFGKHLAAGNSGKSIAESRLARLLHTEVFPMLGKLKAVGFSNDEGWCAFEHAIQIATAGDKNDRYMLGVLRKSKRLEIQQLILDATPFVEPRKGLQVDRAIKGYQLTPAQQAAYREQHPEAGK